MHFLLATVIVLQEYVKLLIMKDNASEGVLTFNCEFSLHDTVQCNLELLIPAFK